MKIIILAGGSGLRLFPVSTADRPKQFLPLAGGAPLIINTIQRFLELCRPEDIVIVTGQKFAGETKDILKQHNLSAVHTVLEPCAKNTAPAIMLGAAYCRDELGASANEPIFAVPSDHIIRPLETYIDTVRTVLDAATRQDRLVVVGITPTHADTGFGYISFSQSGGKVKRVESFVEKPDLPSAQRFVRSGCYLWNAGMFAFNLNCLASELGEHAPEYSAFFARGYSRMLTDFADITPQSIDCAIAEKSDNIYVVQTDIKWSDIGSWDAYYEFCEKDADGNAVIGSVRAADCRNCLLLADSGTLNVLGQKDKIIISSGGEIVALDRRMSQYIKRFLGDL